MRCVALWAVAVFGGLVTVGCSHTQESASRDTMTAQVGMYPPGPSNVNHPRVGVPPFKVQAEGSFGGGNDVNDLAADQMTTLLDQTGRFMVIERTQLQKLLNEQNLEGIVTPGELAKPGKVRGVDYLLLGRVTNLRVKREQTSHGFGVGQVGGLVNLGGAAVNQNEVNIKTECGVDIRLVDPTNGQILTSNFSEFNRSDSANSMGLTILGASAQSNADIQLSEDDKGKILRLALDDALRKSLPKIDKFLRSQPPPPGDSTAAAQPAQPPMQQPAQQSPAQQPANASGAAPSQSTTVAKRFCPNCGHEVAAGVKFCPNCGQKLE